MFEYYEDHEAFYAANGWGCKCCGQLSSTAWWTISGDVYCNRCKIQLKEELGRSIKANRIPKRPAGVAPAVIEIDESRFGFEIAEFQQADYARLHGLTIDGEVVVHAITA